MNLRWMRYETPKIASSHHRQKRIATTLALWACLVVQGHAQDDFTSSDSAIEEPPITASDRDHWAFRPLQRPSLPAWSPASKANHPIDTFILAQLELRDIDPVPAASRRVLVRRLFLDLTGLPPTPDELRQWLDTHVRMPSSDLLTDFLPAHNWVNTKPKAGWTLPVLRKRTGLSMIKFEPRLGDIETGSFRRSIKTSATTGSFRCNLPETRLNPRILRQKSPPRFAWRVRTCQTSTHKTSARITCSTALLPTWDP